jgi:HlyD family secretion protein
MTEAAKPRRRVVFVVIGLLILAAAGVGGAWIYGVAPKDIPARSLALWREWRMPPSDLVLQGNIEVRQVNLGFKVAGRIEKLLVDEGAHVVEGQVLGSLEKVYFQEARALRDQAAANYAKMKAGNRHEDIAQAEANLSLQQATLQNATQTLDRAQALLKSASGTIKAYDDALGAQREATARVNQARHALDLMSAGFRQEDIDAAKAQLGQQDAAVKIVERQLADADLIAPSDGVIQSRAREVGAIVAVGETVFVQSLTTPVWVRTYVSEPDLTRVRPGMEVEVKPDSRDIAPMTGQIGFVSTTAEFTPKTVETRELRTALVYRLRVVVDDPSDVLRQGMPVTVNVIGAGPPTDAPSASR